MKINFFVSLLLLSVIEMSSNAQIRDTLDEIFIFDTAPRIIQIGDRLVNPTIYAGVDGRFMISFASDSIIQAKFYSQDGLNRYQDIPYYRKGDTIILSNHKGPRVPWSICSSDDVSSKEDIPTLAKFFSSWRKPSCRPVHDRYFECEEIYYIDTARKLLFIPYDRCYDKEIIVLSRSGCYVRLQKKDDGSLLSSKKDSFLRIDMSTFYHSWGYEALFDDFPLVIKNDTIFPLADSSKSYQCWIDNGFFFPMMVKSNKSPSEIGTISELHIGLMGTKFEF
jgi:hypothetical protein